MGVRFYVFVKGQFNLLERWLYDSALGSAAGDQRLRLKFADQANFSLGSVDQTCLTSPFYPTTKSIALDQTVEVKYCSDPGVVGRGPMGSQTAQ